MGISYGGEIVEFKIPKDIAEKVGIDVTFNAEVTDSVTSFQPRYRYHWSINNETVTSNDPQITQKLLATESNKQYSVIVKVEKLDEMRTAQSTHSTFDYHVMAKLKFWCQ